ncbi:extracellular solute-binding protein [Aquincola sp. S2]|uniref:Extracellular solute-binding protein n=1 Tax=Pseudaquabacterium terrae TaxID=2732868 RepID=A0ABX2EET3_9BURK|nr:extracellular solute-binding protein [Aquabacterium terrae]NRF67129.1 extracellular solute-binding protein [Aquabacterium terrae]
MLRFFVALMLAAACTLPRAGEQAERAVAAVKELIARGELRADSVLRLRAKQGNMVSFLGRDFELQREWERRTGIVIDASVMPQLDSLEFIRSATDIDLTIARNHEYADLTEAKLIEDLTPLLRRFGFTLAEDADSGYLLPRLQAYVGDKVMAIPADFDAALLFLRQDLMDDAANRARFKERHGRELAAPRTWAEYLQLLEFFHRPKDGFYASAEPREKLTGWMYWLPRYLSAAAPYQPLFDEQMRPLVHGAAGIAATEHYAATVAFSPPQVLEDGKDYSYTLPFFIRGNAFATVLTSATAKISNRDESAVRGKFIAVPMPGQRVGDRLVRRTQIIYGNNLVVPARAPNRLLGFLFAMWLTDPDNATRSVTANGIADPYRRNHLRDERVRALYTPQALQLLQEELAIVAPSGTGLPGDAQYLAALNEHLWLAARGQLSAKEAMARTAAAWEVITDKLGRAKQIAHWQAFRKLYPTATEAAPR